MFVYKVSFVYIYHVEMQAFACHNTHVEVRNNYRMSAGPVGYMGVLLPKEKQNVILKIAVFKVLVKLLVIL